MTLPTSRFPTNSDKLESIVSFGQLGNGATVDAVRGRKDIVVWKQLPSFQVAGSYWAKALGIGGWSVDVNHVYDITPVLWRGDGERERPSVDLRTTDFVTQFTQQQDTLPQQTDLGHYYMATGPDGYVYLAQADRFV
jgi:hypothetical protein